MNSIAQEAHFHQGVIKYAQKHGVTAASVRFKVSRMSVYRWKARYDGNWRSLQKRSHRPHHRPNEQMQAEYDLIKRSYYDEMIMLWGRLREKGYKHCYQTMLRAIIREIFKLNNKNRITKKQPHKKEQSVKATLGYYCVKFRSINWNF